VYLLHTCILIRLYTSIIAVHGLGGNWLKTWRADDGAIWLRDRLPQLLGEKNIQARVLSYGYDADFIFTNTINDIEIVARDLLDQVHSIRTTDEQKKAPIIFVAHSLGGLVVKAVSCVIWTPHLSYTDIIRHSTKLGQRTSTTKMSSKKRLGASSSAFRIAVPIWLAGLAMLPPS
jgi:hypothetical protein